MVKQARNERRTLAELAEASGVPARTIRYYIARGVLPPPLVVGRGACYAEEHLERLARIQALQSQGQTLGQIAWQLSERPIERPLPQPSTWWNYPLSDDVVVQVRCETRPWRLKRVRSLIRQMAAQLNSPQHEEENDAR
jgi:DNA-binding transcriptional MerR regulator